MLKASEKTDKSDDSPVTIADYGESFCSIHGVLSLFIRLVTWPAPPQLGPPISSPSVRMSATAKPCNTKIPTLVRMAYLASALQGRRHLWHGACRRRCQARPSLWSQRRTQMI